MAVPATSTAASAGRGGGQEASSRSRRSGGTHFAALLDATLTKPGNHKSGAGEHRVHGHPLTGATAKPDTPPGGARKEPMPSPLVGVVAAVSATRKGQAGHADTSRLKASHGGKVQPVVDHGGTTRAAVAVASTASGSDGGSAPARSGGGVEIAADQGKVAQSTPLARGGDAQAAPAGGQGNATSNEAALVHGTSQAGTAPTAPQRPGGTPSDTPVSDTAPPIGSRGTQQIPGDAHVATTADQVAAGTIEDGKPSVIVDSAKGGTSVVQGKAGGSTDVPAIEIVGTGATAPKVAASSAATEDAATPRSVTRAVGVEDQHAAQPSIPLSAGTSNQSPAQASVPVASSTGSMLSEHLMPVLAAAGRGTDGTWTLSVALSPPDLGSVQAVVALRNGVVSVRLLAETPAGARALQASQPEIEAAVGGNVTVDNSGGRSDGGASRQGASGQSQLQSQAHRNVPEEDGIATYVPMRPQGLYMLV